MSTLETIRNKAGVLVSVVIGAALLAFLLPSTFTGGSSNGPTDDVATMGSSVLSYKFYMTELAKRIEIEKKNTNTSALKTETMDQLKEQVWNKLLRDFVLQGEFDKLGLGLTNNELYDMLEGDNIPKEVENALKNPQTGIYDKEYVLKLIRQIDEPGNEELKANWINFEDQLVDIYLFSKYSTAVSKGLYATTKYSTDEAVEKNTKYNFQIVAKKYKDISDSLITINDSDLRKYYNENKHKFIQKASRDIEFVEFPIVYSSEDIDDAKAWTEKIAKEFKTVDDNIQFTNSSSDSPFNGTYYKAGELPKNLDSILFAAEVGFVSDIYRDKNSFKVAKLIEIKELPDTVKASHILAKVDKEHPYEVAKSLIDSLKTLVDNGADFAQLATKFGTDATKEKGGDLGWFKQDAMVYPFNDTCFFANKGDVKIVNTQFGIHLVKVTDKGETSKKVQVAIIQRDIIPGSNTYKNIYAKANNFAGLNTTVKLFDKAVADNGLNKKLATIKSIDKYINGISKIGITGKNDKINTRDIVRWAFNLRRGYGEISEGAISQVFEYEDRFVVVKLASVRDEGTASFNNKKEQIEPIVKKDKKAEQLMKEFNKYPNPSSLEELAKSLNTKVTDVENLTFSSFSVPGGIGIEPNINGVVAGLKKGEISKPIKGNYGVYVVKLIDVKTDEKIDNISEKELLENNMQRQVERQGYDALKKKLDVKDLRAEFE